MNSIRMRIGSIVFLWFTLSLPIWCQERVDLGPDREKDREFIESMIMAPCCWQPVGVHDSGVSSQIKEEIQRRLLAGESRETIIQAFIHQDGPIRQILADYGVRGQEILAKPMASGFNRMAYIMPVFGVLLGMTLVFFLLHKLYKRQTSALPQASPQTAYMPSNDPLRQKIEEELTRIDY